MDPRLHAQAIDAQQAVRAGSLRGQALLDLLLTVPFQERDAWVDALLGLTVLPQDATELPRDGVPYLPCEVDAIVRAVREAPVQATDVFVDLGAGVGRPALLVHLLTGARAHGIEVQPHLVEEARAAAARLNLSGVQLTPGDATQLDLPDATVVFIYASFNGDALSRVLRRLESAAEHRPLTLCAVSFELTGVPWLSPRRSSSPDLVFYETLRRRRSIDASARPATS